MDKLLCPCCQYPVVTINSAGDVWCATEACLMHDVTIPRKAAEALAKLRVPPPTRLQKLMSGIKPLPEPPDSDIDNLLSELELAAVDVDKQDGYGPPRDAYNAAVKRLGLAREVIIKTFTELRRDHENPTRDHPRSDRDGDTMTAPLCPLCNRAPTESQVTTYGCCAWTTCPLFGCRITEDARKAIAALRAPPPVDGFDADVIADDMANELGVEHAKVKMALVNAAMNTSSHLPRPGMVRYVPAPPPAEDADAALEAFHSAVRLYAEGNGSRDDVDATKHALLARLTAQPPRITREQAVEMCARYHRALHAMKTYSTVAMGVNHTGDVGVEEAQAAEDAIVDALTAPR